MHGPEQQRHPAEQQALQERLQHVYWIGGGSAAGKSTIAGRLASQYGLRLYATDDVMAEHARRADPEESPRLREFITMNMDERSSSRAFGCCRGA